jgi:membrane protein implicated in regulation of membrane protease activity
LEDFQEGSGQVLFDGEIWQATSTDTIRKGEMVKVIHLEGLKMTVKKIDKAT